MFGHSGNRIVYVNEANEVFYHRVRGNRVDRQIQMRGHAVGVRGIPVKYVIPEGNDRILVVTQRGDLYRHQIRAETIGPPTQIPGAPIGTHGQEPFFMFMIGNRLINVTRSGEIWAHTITNTVSPPQQIGRHAIATPRAVRHIFNTGRQVHIISEHGEVYSHDINPNLGRGRLLNARALVLGQPTTRFVFPMGNRLYAVSQHGELWAHDISRLVRPRPRDSASAEDAPPTAPEAPAPAE